MSEIEASDPVEVPLMKRRGLALNTRVLRRPGSVAVWFLAFAIALLSISIAMLTLSSKLLGDVRLQAVSPLPQTGSLKNTIILVTVISVGIKVPVALIFFAVCKKSKPIIMLSSILLICLMILEIVACILFGYYRPEATFERQLSAQITRLVNPRSEGTAVDNWRLSPHELTFIESALSCCGSVGSHEYLDRNANVPISCYSSDAYGRWRVNTQGCVEAVQSFLMGKSLTLGLLCVVAIILEFVLLMLGGRTSSRFSRIAPEYEQRVKANVQPAPRSMQARVQQPVNESTWAPMGPEHSEV